MEFLKNNILSRLSLKPISIGAMAALSLCSAANAAINLDFVYDTISGDTTASYAGTWDIAGTGVGVIDVSRSSATYFQMRPAGWGPLITQSVSGAGLSGPYAWDVYQEGVSTGDPFGFDLTYVYGPSSFTSSTIIAGSVTYAGVNLTDLGFDAAEIANGGTLTGTGGTVNWTASVVPEPSTYAAILGFISLAFVTIRRRRS